MKNWQYIKIHITTQDNQTLERLELYPDDPGDTEISLGKHVKKVLETKTEAVEAIHEEAQTDPYFQISSILRTLRAMKEQISLMEQELSSLRPQAKKARLRAQALARVRRHRANKGGETK